VASKVFGDLADRFRARPGGYTRVTKLRRRVGDAASLSLVTLVEGAEAEKPKGKAKAKAEPKAAKAAARPKAKAAKAAAKGKAGAKEEKKPRERRKKAAGEKS
jgi:large subunit ribosomal protein L17